MGCGALIIFLLICLVLFPVIGFSIGLAVVIGGVILALVMIYGMYDSACDGDYDEFLYEIPALLISIGVILGGIWLMDL